MFTFLFHTKRIAVLLLVAFVISINCGGAQKKVRVADDDVKAITRSAPMLWLNESPDKWERDFSGSELDTSLSLPEANLEDENIGQKQRVFDLFDRWQLTEEIRADRGTQFVDITNECKGKIELDFALTPEEWENPEIRTNYYQRVEKLIEKIGQ